MSNMLSTEISNGTNHKLKVQIRCGRDASDVGTIETSKKIQIRVDRNATYHEYTVGVAAAVGPQSLVMSSDDLCDNKCITIKEESGELKVQNVPRTTASTAAAADVPSKPAKKTSWMTAWTSK